MQRSNHFRPRRHLAENILRPPMGHCQHIQHRVRPQDASGGVRTARQQGGATWHLLICPTACARCLAIVGVGSRRRRSEAIGGVKSERGGKEIGGHDGGGGGSGAEGERASRGIV
jgi:hypothetical protein